MKKILTLSYLIAILMCSVVVGISEVSAGVQDFHFSDFTGDYYLSKDEEGISHLKVVERLTAEFPDFNQNKGICRQIPFTNRDGLNVTLPSLTKSNIKITRNGEIEPIYSIEKESSRDGYYDVCTGTDDYLQGTQVYVLEYEFTKVVTDFDINGKLFQELYWDTNGNGWRQRFDQLTARLHFDDPKVWSGESWCYVGKYKESGKDRCNIEKIEDGVSFQTSRLAVGENLTFDVELLAGSFVVPEPEENYAYVWITILLGVICVVAIVWSFKKYLATRNKARHYKGFFVKPEYQPNSQYSLPEMAEIYIGKKKDSKVAMLLDLVVKRKIEFVKGEKKRQWKINVKDLEGVSEEYMDLLSILNNGTRPAAGDVIELKSRSATNRLITLKKSMESKVVGDLKRDELVEAKYHFGSSGSSGIGNIIVTMVVMAPVMVMIGIVALKMFFDLFGIDSAYGQKMVFGEKFYAVALIMIVVTVLICAILSDATQKYKNHSMKGLEMSRYMDGLKLYIGMAEADRLKMLQSVEGADTSAEGIVRLYEKLLPYAAVFGLEESWMNEMKEYCQVEEIEEPDYLMAGLAASEISRSLNRAASIATTSTVMSSSGGGSSSGFSGGGGGGFSGGGGGGGGGGGR